MSGLRFQFETDADAGLVITSLRVAAERFDEDAQVAEAAGHAHLARQFADQSRNARRIADGIEEVRP